MERYYFINLIVTNLCPKGIYIWNDGKVYEGEWRKNKMHGKGICKWVGGRIYEGEYENDKKHVN